MPVKCSKHMKSRISNIKLILPSDKERVFVWVKLWTTFLDFEHEESQFLHVLVC